jgi:PST family polysaccharide transporter
MSGGRLKPFDSLGASLIETEKSKIRGLAVRGAGLFVVAQALAFVIQVGGTIVLARILMPADFGVVSMVTIFSQLLCSIGLNGFTEAVIQRENIDHFLVSNLFWINLALGVCLTFGFAYSGSVLAWFYKDPRVANVCVGISASIFLYSAFVVHMALLKRAMRFSLISIIDIIARLSGVTISIGLAVAGWGYWAIVAQSVAWPLAICLGAWYACRWIPAFPRRVPGTGSMVRFATNVYSHFIVSYAGSNADNFLVGWRFQAGALGSYKRAYDLFVLPANQLLAPVSAVAMSALSKFKQDPVQFRRHFLMALSVFAFLGMAISADLTLVGRDAVRLLLGARWEESGRIFMFFGPGIGAMLLNGMHGWIHVSIGRADRWFRWGLIEFVVTLVFFVACLHWGPVGIAIAWSASLWILFLPAIWYAGRPIHLGIGETLSAVWRYVVASLVAGVTSAVLIGWFPSLSALSGILGTSFRICADSLLFVALYLLLVLILHRGPAPLHQLMRLAQEMLPQRWLPKQRVHQEAPVKEIVQVSAGPVGTINEF